MLLLLAPAALVQEKIFPNSLKWGEKKICARQNPQSTTCQVRFLRPFLCIEPNGTQTSHQGKCQGLLLTDMPQRALHLLQSCSHFNPRASTENTNKTLSIICLKLCRDLLHSRNRTHAPSTASRVLCDLLPLVHVTSSPSSYLSYPLALFKQGQPLPPAAMVLGERVVAASIRTTLPGTQHPRQWLSASVSPSPDGLTNLVSVSPITQLSSRFLSHLMPSTSTVPGTQQAFNKYLWIKDQKLQESEDWKDLETRVGKGCRSVSGWTWQTSLAHEAALPSLWAS